MSKLQNGYALLQLLVYQSWIHDLTVMEVVQLLVFKINNGFY